MSECHDHTHALLSQFGTRGSHAADAVIHHIIGPLEERAAATEALLAEAQEVLEFYALLGSRKAVALVAKIKQREISPP